MGYRHLNLVLARRPLSAGRLGYTLAEDHSVEFANKHHPNHRDSEDGRIGVDDGGREEASALL